MKFYYLLLIFSITLFFFSCGNNNETTIFSTDKFDEDDFAVALENIFSTSINNTSKKKIATEREKMLSIYKSNKFLPLWLKEDGETNLAENLLQDLDSIRNDGIDPQRYQLNNLKDQLNKFQSSSEDDINEIIHLDTLLTYNYLKASRELLLGIIVPKRVDSLWYHSNDSTWKPETILVTLQENKYPSLDSFRSKITTYNLLKKSLQHYNELSKNESFLRLKNYAANSQNISDSIVHSIIALETPWLKPISDTISGSAATIQSYQQYFGLKRTGKIDGVTLAHLQHTPQEMIAIIKANLERFRWMQQKMEPDYILVNIPTMELTLKNDGAEAMHMNVIVGKSSRQTPCLNARLANVVFNPPWGVPPTILKKDVLPGITKSGGDYLNRKGLKAYDGKGNLVDVESINASNYKKYFYKQPPGADNALGYVKFNFPNKWDIYLHDTPHREDFTKYDRAKSSGCIRVQEPRELAEYILTQMEGRNFDQIKIDSLIQTQKTKYETLKNKIPVHIVYLTAYEDPSGSYIRFARDFYHRDAKLMAALSK